MTRSFVQRTTACTIVVSMTSIWTAPTCKRKRFRRKSDMRDQVDCASSHNGHQPHVAIQGSLFCRSCQEPALCCPAFSVLIVTGV